MKIAQTIASRGPLAVRTAKRVMREGAELPLVDALSLELQSFQELFDAQEPRQGMTAHLARQNPNF